MKRNIQSFPMEKPFPIPLFTHRELISDSYISVELSILFRRTRFSSRGLGKYILSLLLSWLLYSSRHGTLLVNPLIADVLRNDITIVERDSIEIYI